jgi:hypothetical protein
MKFVVDKISSEKKFQESWKKYNYEDILISVVEPEP